MGLLRVPVPNVITWVFFVSVSIAVFALVRQRVLGELLQIESNSTMASREKEEWHVKIFRRTERGWEKQTSGDGIVTASPRKGCIEVRVLKLRIALSHEDDDPTSHENSSVGDRCLLVRRGKAILIHSTRRLRSIVLMFQSETECLEFSDRLVMLNPSNIQSCSLMTQNLIATPHPVDHGHAAATALEPTRAEYSQEAQSYLVRLLHDEGFLQLVQNIESNLTSSDDGVKMLNAFAQKDG